MLSTTPVRLWSRARQRLVETDHISFLPSKQSRLLRKEQNGTTEIGEAAETSEKRKRETKETTKTKETDWSLRNVDFTPNSAYGISGLFLSSGITERRGGHVEMHRSLKTDCPDSILAGRQFFVLISSVMYIFSFIFYDAFL